jgi:hypothetical protein
MASWLVSTEPDMALGRLADVTAPSVHASAALDVSLEALGTTTETWVTVTDSGERAVHCSDTLCL